MINLETVKALRSLKLSAMARELESQLEEPQRYKGLSFEDRLALLIEAERISRRKNAIRKRITDDKLTEPTASIEAIEYHEDRELDKGLITKLATCSYIQENHHVVSQLPAFFNTHSSFDLFPCRNSMTSARVFSLSENASSSCLLSRS